MEGVTIGFADFFHRLGGIASFGFPKTDARQDDYPQAVLRTPGRPVDSRIRQYFQAAILEYHLKSPASPVKLSLLGDTLRNHRYPRRAWQQYLGFGPQLLLAVGDQLQLGLESRRGPHGPSIDDAAAFLELSLLRVTTDQECGSGFFVTQSGYALTTWRLVADAATISVASPRGYAEAAHLVAGDAELDIALIKVSGDDHIPVTWANAPSLALGTQLVALGYDATSSQMSQGVDCRSVPIATLLSLASLTANQPTYFRPSIEIGNSGGPVATSSGHVVGMIASASSELPRADFLIRATDAQLLVESWLEDIDRGLIPTLPTQPRSGRVLLAERDLLACPEDGGLEVRGSNSYLTATVTLDPVRIPTAIIRLRNAYDVQWQSHDQINFGQTWLDSGSSMLTWTRDNLGQYIIIRSGYHVDISSGLPFHFRLVYNAGIAALYINGNLEHLEKGLPYGDHIWLSIECFGWTGIPSMYYSDLRVLGVPLPQN